tara:strand:+ start:126 stop:575 length:450 start_codon:yes stop_codon:yes gene_type:complete
MTPAVITLSKPGYMTTHFENAKAFRTAFGQPLLKGFCTGPVLHKGPTELQARLIGEEHAEFQEAVGTYIKSPTKEHKIHLLKELADLTFTVYQFAAAFSLDLDEALQRVFASNMSKLNSDGIPIYRADGKVLKGENYKPVDLTDLVSNN